MLFIACFRWFLPALFLLGAILFPSVGWAVQVPLTLFPIENYDQNVDTWLSPKDSHYDVALLSAAYQQQRFAEFFRHYFSTKSDGLSPWSRFYIEQVFQEQGGVQSLQKELLEQLSNKNKSPQLIGYGENFRPHTEQWIENITRNMDLPALGNLKFQPANRGILVNNIALRALPTRDPHFYWFGLAGQGYPFDNLQVSALWTGTPVYILGETKDHNWLLIAAPGVIGWVEAAVVARANDNFVRVWERLARNQLIAITHIEVPIVDARNQAFQFAAYVGAVFPVFGVAGKDFKILIPTRDSWGQARIHYALVSKEHAVRMPLLATPRNFAKLLKAVQNRPYGWGGIYFYNDCSAELKNLYTPFGIWLNRHSSDQMKTGRLVDLASASREERINYLIQHGHPLMTVVYIGGHVFLYVGNYPNPQDPQRAIMAMTYQTIWGLKPLNQEGRAVIGKAAFIPLLATFPEDPSLMSQASKSIFQVNFIDEWPDKAQRTIPVFEKAS